MARTFALAVARLGPLHLVSASRAAVQRRASAWLMAWLQPAVFAAEATGAALGSADTETTGGMRALDSGGRTALGAQRARA